MSNNKTKKRLPGELLLALAMVINALAVNLMIKANFGLSTLSSVPYVLYKAFPVLSLGTWNAVIQCAWLLVTMLAIRKWKPGYLLSFALAYLFGLLLDAWVPMMAGWSDAMLPRLVYFAAGFFLMSVGISFFFLCGTPVLPFDTVPRAFVMEKGISVLAARMGLDLLSLCLSLAIGLIFLGRVEGVGPGTVIYALLMGPLVSRITKWIQARYQVAPRIQALERLI